MREKLTLAAAALLFVLPANAHSQDAGDSERPSSEEMRSLSADLNRAEDEFYAKIEVVRAAETFFAALRSNDKTALARTMRDDGVIYVHDRRDPQNPRIATRATGEHLTRWESSPQGTDEYMRYDTVLVDGDMALIWGPYVFLLNGEPTHCGINSMSLARTGEGWRVSNTSFTMTSLDECAALGAPEGPRQ